MVIDGYTSSFFFSRNFKLDARTGGELFHQTPGADAEELHSAAVLPKVPLHAALEPRIGAGPRVVWNGGARWWQPSSAPQNGVFFFSEKDMGHIGDMKNAR